MQNFKIYFFERQTLNTEKWINDTILFLKELRISFGEVCKLYDKVEIIDDLVTVKLKIGSLTSELYEIEEMAKCRIGPLGYTTFLEGDESVMVKSISIGEEWAKLADGEINSLRTDILQLSEFVESDMKEKITEIFKQ